MSVENVSLKLNPPIEEKIHGYRKFLYNYKNSEGILIYHLGRDYGGYLADPVYSINLPGVVVFAGNINGFGALAPVQEPGGVVIIKHRLIDEEFHVLYGHLNISADIFEGKEIDGRVLIGTLNGFKNYGLDGKTILVLPHCHNGIWLSKKPIEGKLGYDSKIRYWIDPDKFYNNPMDYYFILKNNNI